MCVLGAALLATACGSHDENTTASTGTPDGSGDFDATGQTDTGSDLDAGSLGPGDAGAGSLGDADAGPAVGASVLGFHDHINRDGFYIDPSITRATAATMHLDPTFDGTLTGNVYAQPLYVENGPGGKGAFYAVTESNDVYALDEVTGKPDWHVNMGTAASHSYSGGCGNISPIGITGTPAIDLASRTIVFNAVTADAMGNIATHTIYGLSIDDGTERWHLDVSTMKDQLGRAFLPGPQNQRSAVLLVGGVAYVTYGGHAGDCGNYHGWIVGVPLGDSASAKAYATPITAAGLWAPGGPASDGTSVFVVTGNREDYSSPGNDMWQGSEGVLRLSAGPVFSAMKSDYWAPMNWDTALDPSDLDLGGSGPLVVDAPALTPSAVVVAQGKDGNLYVIDRNDLGGVGAAIVGQKQVMSGAIINAGAFATVGGTTYVVLHGHSGAGVGCAAGAGDLVALKLAPTDAGAVSSAWCANNLGAGSPIITTSDGQANALVWTAGAGEQRPAPRLGPRDRSARLHRRRCRQRHAHAAPLHDAHRRPRPHPRGRRRQALRVQAVATSEESRGGAETQSLGESR